jgi:DNA-binding SARP family transcriptional activator/tetratricopeptide (TPR) repeat protein
VQELTFSLLGPPRGWRGPTDLRLGSPQQRAVLAVLLLRPTNAVSLGDLVDALWGEELPGSAATTVRTYAWRLRQVLESNPEDPSVLVSLGDGYRLVLPPGAVDVQRAEQAAALAEAAVARGCPQEARDLLSGALELWRGEPLNGIPGPFAERHRSRLSEWRLSLLEDRLGLDVDLGQGARLIPELTELTAEHPYRERPYGLLMLALYRAGRQADALAVFRTARRLLIDDLGVEPGLDLTLMHQRVLDNDPELIAAADRGATTAWAPPKPAQLPPDVPDFGGREHAVQQISHALSESPPGALAVVAVTGMGGVGKTVLAVHTAHLVRNAFPDGVLYAVLRTGGGSPVDPEAVLADFLGALGVPPEAVPADLAARAAMFRSLTDGRRLLIVLDDAEDGARIRSLLPGAEGCAVLVTGRGRLAGGWPLVNVDLDVFDPPDALGLLGRIIGGARLAAEPQAALDAVAACGFLPLAVRIVAARLVARPAWSIRDMADRLADERRRLDELRVGDLAVETAFEVGYRQLDEHQALAFRVLSWVDGPDIGVGAAAAILGVDAGTADGILESLVDVAMIESPAPGRYRYHDLLRAFARRLPPHDDAARRVASRLLDFLLAHARAAFQLAVPGDPVADALGQGRPLAPVPRGEMPDLAAARAWAAAEGRGAIAVAGGVAALVQRGGEGIGDDDLDAAIDLLITLSPFEQSAPAHSLESAARSLVAAAVQRGDRKGEGRARFLLGHIALGTARLTEAQAEGRLAVEACREVGDAVILRQALNDLGLAASWLRRDEEAVACFGEAIELARRLGHHSGEVATVINAALVRLRMGQVEEAAFSCATVLDEVRALHDGVGTAYALYVLGLAHHTMGGYPEAVDYFGECITVSTAAGLRAREASARYRLADSFRALGHLRRAEAEAELALSICVEIGAERDRAHALVVLGRTLADRGLEDASRRRFEQARALFEQLGLPDADDVAALLRGLPVGACTQR